MCTLVLNKGGYTFKALDHIVGVLGSATSAVFYAKCHTRALQRDLIVARGLKLNRWQFIPLGVEQKEDILWWKDSFPSQNSCPITIPAASIDHFTDASPLGFGSRTYTVQAGNAVHQPPQLTTRVIRHTGTKVVQIPNNTQDVIVSTQSKFTKKESN